MYYTVCSPHVLAFGRSVRASRETLGIVLFFILNFSLHHPRITVRVHCHICFVAVTSSTSLTNQPLTRFATCGERLGAGDSGKRACFLSELSRENNSVFVFFQYCDKTYSSIRVVDGGSNDVRFIDGHTLAGRRG